MEVTVDWETALLLAVELPEEQLVHLQRLALEQLASLEQMEPSYTTYFTETSDKAAEVAPVELVNTAPGELVVMRLQTVDGDRIILEILRFTVQVEPQVMMQLVDRRTLLLGPPVEPKPPL
jgi:hypothetical protein